MLQDLQEGGVIKSKMNAMAVVLIFFEIHLIVGKVILFLYAAVGKCTFTYIINEISCRLWPCLLS